jgi:hypothetical protein
MEITEAPEDRANRYRCTAAHLRQQADALDKTQERQELLAIADQYDRLAGRLSGPGDAATSTRRAGRVRGRRDSPDASESELRRPAAE